MLIIRHLTTLALFIITTVLANTETINFHKTHTLVANKHEDTNKVLKGVEGFTQLTVHFQPIIKKSPIENRQIEEITVDFNEFEDNLHYGVKLCWCAINPVSVDLTVDKSENLLMIKVTSDYYGVDEDAVGKYLQDVKLNLHITRNMINREMAEMMQYIVAVLVTAVSVACVAF